MCFLKGQYLFGRFPGKCHHSTDALDHLAFGDHHQVLDGPGPQQVSGGGEGQ